MWSLKLWASVGQWQSCKPGACWTDIRSHAHAHTCVHIDVDLMYMYMRRCSKCIYIYMCVCMYACNACMHVRMYVLFCSTEILLLYAMWWGVSNVM